MAEKKPQRGRNDKEAIANLQGTVRRQAAENRQLKQKASSGTPAGLKKVVRRVPARAGVAAHDETYWVKAGQEKLSERFDQGIEHSKMTGKQQKRDVAESGAPIAKTRKAEDSSPAEPVSYGPFGPGGVYDVTGRRSEGLAMVTAQYANEVLRDPQRVNPQQPLAARQKQALDIAIKDVRIAIGDQSAKERAAARETGATGDSRYNIQKLNIGRIRELAFDPRLSSLSEAEKAQHVQAKSKIKPLRGEARSAPDQEPLSDEQIAKSKKSRAQARLLKPGAAVKKSSMTTSEFLRTRSPDEQKWIDQQTNSPEGLFYGMKGNRVPGAYRRWQRYVNARTDPMGYDDLDNIQDWLKADMRGKTSTTNPNRSDKKESDQIVKSTYTKGIIKKEGRKSSDRYKSLAPSHEEFGVGIRVPGIPTTSQLEDMYPDKSDSEIFQMRESVKQSVDETLQNQRMSHETRQATILGRKPSEGGAAGPADRVVFFTTSTGHPALSVSANSLIGQYIIKKRKKMIYDQRMAPRAALKGEFPYAVRDQHVIEAASGLSLGAQGRYGAFRQIGYRAGSKKSKGYGKMLPVGSQILRDSSGQALYDRNGNLRYTEGFTRPFDVRPNNEVGLRIYLG